MHRTPWTIMLVLFGLVAPNAWGHKPVVIDGGATGPDSAYVIDDVSVSQVGYHTVTPDAPQLWFTFDAEAGQELYFELGVPRIDRLEGIRPAMVLLGPGLPELSLPFVAPEGLGGIVFDTAAEMPEVFDEEFTGTTSWKWPAITPTAPDSGQFYAVAWLPTADTGKLWMAVGRAESFGLSDILTLPATLFQVRAFHEISPFGGLLFWAMLAFLFVVVVLLRLLI